MKKLTIIVVALLSAALCASSATAERPADKGKRADKAPKVDRANRGKSQAAKLCVAERRADRAAFRATYGRHAMRTCIKGETPEMRQEVRNAARECRAERQADPDAFRDKYATNRKGRNAFGKCVSGSVRQERSEEATEFRNAAQECRAERSADADAFRDEYGSNRNKRNAFGKCVSMKVKDDADDGADA